MYDSREITKEEQIELFRYYPELTPIIVKARINLIVHRQLMDLALNFHNGKWEDWMANKLRKIVKDLSNSIKE